ncbi:MAG: sigma-70 family RNA polymerase sigma factor [Candidatus Poribacteria bacterium]|nr:sigma-70 family RNA polymerase sigma factor [Candidatus Poribacteria bacterium]
MKKNDVELIHSILLGDEHAFSILVKKYQKSVHALAWRKVGDFHIAEEITQDTFLQAHKKLASLKNPSQFAGWLYVITDRLCRSWLRKRQLKMQSLETISEETLEETDYSNYVREQREDTAVEHRRRIVQGLMAKLPESERTVMVLYYLGEMTCEEISKFLGVSSNTVRSRLQRGRKRLKNEEQIIQETLGSIPLSPNLIENIMRNIDVIQQTSPSGGKPFLPLAALGSSVILVILLMGASNQYITRSQQPYSLDAQSEPTIEIVDVSIVLDIQSKPNLQNRVGNDTTPGKNSNKGLPTGTKSMKNNTAQESTQWNLPEDAKARLGKGKISEIQYSSDGTLLVVATGIGIWIYDTTTYQEVALLTTHTSAVKCLAFSPDGNLLASADNEGTILLWHRSTGAQKVLTRGLKWVSNLVFSPDGKTIASGRVGTIRFWDTITGEEKDALTGLPENIGDLSFSPDGKTIVSVTWSGEICILDRITGEPQKTFAVPITDSVFSITFSPDRNIVAIGSRDGNIYLSDLNTGKLMRKLTGHSVDVQRVVFSPDGKTLASSSYIDETVRIWDVSTGKPRRTLTEHTGDIEGLAFSPDGKTLVSSGSGDGTIRFWDVRTGNQKHAVTGHADYVYSVAFNPDGKFFASGYADGSIRFWDAETGLHLKTFKKGYEASGLVFSEDGKTLAYAEGLDIRLQDAGTGEEKMLLTGHEWGMHSMALSPDGDILASGSEDTTIRLWDMHTGAHKKTLNGHKHRVYSVAFSPDGKTLASGSDDNTIRLWNVDTGETERILTGHAGEFEGVDNGPSSVEGVKSVAFSPDGKTLASGGGDNVIHLWDIGTGKSKMTLVGHTHWVFSLAFSPDGKTLASGSVDSDIRLWDPHTGQPKKTLTGHGDWVRSIAFSPDGKTLVSGSDDGSVLLWRIDP